MSINRLYSFERGQLIRSSWLDDELNQLVTEVNLKFPLTGGTLPGAKSIGLDFTGSSDFKGTRGVLTYYTEEILDSSDGYIATPSFTASSSEASYVLNRAGSIVGYSVASHCSLMNSALTYKVDFKKNTSTIFSSASISHSAADIKTDRNTFARGTYTFSAGDRWGAYVDITSAGEISTAIRVTLEVQVDT